MILEVLTDTSKNGGDKRRVNVRCTCGNEFETYLYNVKRKQMCDECAKVKNRKKAIILDFSNTITLLMEQVAGIEPA